MKVLFLGSLMYETNFVLEKHCFGKFRIKCNFYLNPLPSYKIIILYRQQNKFYLQ